MDNLISDLRYAFRTLVRNPAFTVVAIASLALGIGVNVVIFSVVNAVLQKPVSGVRDPDRLVRVYRGSHSPISYEDFRFFRERVASLSGFVGERTQGVTIDRSGEAVAVQAAVVPEDYFAVLGVSAAVGRLFTDAASAESPVVV